MPSSRVKLMPELPTVFPFVDFILNKPRVLVFGSRNWPAPELIGQDMRKLKRVIGDYTLVEGEAQGADQFAVDYALYLGLDIDRFPARWNEYGNAAGPIRNQEMVDSGLDYAMGYVFNDSKGSADMAGRVNRAKVPLRVAVMHFNHSEGFPVFSDG